MEKTSEVLNGCEEKIRVSSAEIVVHGTKEKPYYEIKYRELSDGQIHIGYSSYNLDFVFEWLKECFETMPEKEDDRMSISEQVRELREIAKNFSEWEYNRFYDTISRAANTIESLSAKMQAKEYCDGCPGVDIIEIPCTEECKRRHFKAENMQRSAEDCGGGWTPCDKDNLPDKEVLCCDQCGEMILGYVSEDKTSDTGFCAENDNVYMYNCVKWMEKPKP